MLICPPNYKGTPADCSLLLQGLSFTFWTSSCWSGIMGGKRECCSGIQFSRAKGMNPLQFISFHRAKRVIEMLILRSRSPVFSSRINFLIWRKRSRRETGAVKERMRKKKNIKWRTRVFFFLFFTIRQRGWNVGTANKSSPCNRHHNPCKITQQRCVCARARMCVFFFNHRSCWFMVLRPSSGDGVRTHTDKHWEFPFQSEPK